MARATARLLALAVPACSSPAFRPPRKPLPAVAADAERRIETVLKAVRDIATNDAAASGAAAKAEFGWAPRP